MTRTDFSKYKACTFRYHIFKTKSVFPIYFCISDTSNSLAISSRGFVKLSMLEDFRANVLKLAFPQGFRSCVAVMFPMLVNRWTHNYYGSAARKLCRHTIFHKVSKMFPC